MTSSGGARRCGGGRQPAVVGDNGYVETDPTGRYGRFDELLGKGAMKSVYRGFDEERGVEVAWNQASLRDVLRSPDAVQRMYCEVQLLSTLRHDAIISFHASWVDAPRRTFNFITELFSSGTLRSFRRRYPRVSPRAVRSWARQVLRGLAYLHAHDPPVIHRDLKCDNLFVNGHLGQVKIGDLGLAAMLREAGQAAHSVIGTPEFMAPEMYDEEYDELVDVYSFGMCVLEMITLELPYAECSNPAQIYKKVTAGKLPDAFYRVRDDEARRFIGRCLVAAADRPSAAELLQDPFLLDDHHPSPVSPRPPPPSARSDVPGVFASSSSATTSDDGSLSSSSSDDHHQPPPAAKQKKKKKNDMTITGKLNAEEDTIFLKVQIVADATGHVRNIYFPFDVAGDTATDVAREMVKELDITDRDPSEIAAVIEQEIRKLLPRGRGREQQQQHEYSYDDDDENGEQPPPPFYYLSSSPASSVGGFSVGGPQRSTSWSKDHYYCYPLSDDDDTSSMHSGKYDDLAHHHVLPEEGEEKMHGGRPSSSSSSSSSKACCNTSRLGPLSPPGDTSSRSPIRSRVVPAEPCSRVHAHVGRPRRRNNDDDGKQVRFGRNRSMVDMRSQLLHRTLVEELNRRLFFNTVGAVENIGFRAPPGYGGGSSSSSTRGRGSRRSRDA